MWQFLVVAAVAGSTGFFAEHLRAGVTRRKRIRKCGQKRPEQVLPGSDQLGICDESRRLLEISAESVETQVSNPTALQPPLGSQGVFRFSSPEGGIGDGSRPGARNLRGKGRVRVRSGKGGGSELKLGMIGGGGGVVRTGDDQRKGARRVSICLKKRRTGKNSAAEKRGSFPSEGGSALFSWGLGVGMMYMISAGKSEIGKLNTSMDETAKAIEELKAEFKKKESSSSTQIKGFGSEVKTNTKKCSSECPSSVVTEEQDPEVLEMDQLEAEFVSELQKLPWCEASQNLHEFDAVNDKEDRMERRDSDSYPFEGVKPSELDKKLSHLLIAQQENQIIELESELQSAQSKLNGKESELKALKDCVRHLTELSLSTITDDDTEVGCADILDYNNMVGLESKRSVVGMKRSIDSELCG